MVTKQVLHITQSDSRCNASLFLHSFLGYLYLQFQPLWSWLAWNLRKLHKMFIYVCMYLFTTLLIRFDLNKVFRLPQFLPHCSVWKGIILPGFIVYIFAIRNVCRLCNKNQEGGHNIRIEGSLISFLMCLVTHLNIAYNSVELCAVYCYVCITWSSIFGQKKILFNYFPPTPGQLCFIQRVICNYLVMCLKTTFLLQ